MPIWTFLSSILSTTIGAASGSGSTSIRKACSVPGVRTPGERPTASAAPSLADCRSGAARSVGRLTHSTVEPSSTGVIFRLRRSRELLRGVVQGKSASQMARELDLSRTTVHEIRQQLQANATLLQPETPLSDEQTETDEMFQNAGKKGDLHPDPEDPPRRRASKAQGHETYEKDRPPAQGIGPKKRDGAFASASPHRRGAPVSTCPWMYLRPRNGIHRRVERLQPG